MTEALSLAVCLKSILSCQEPTCPRGGGPSRLQEGEPHTGHHSNFSLGAWTRESPSSCVCKPLSCSCTVQVELLTLWRGVWPSFLGMMGHSRTTTFSSIQFSHSVMSDSLRPMDCSMPGFPVHHQLRLRSFVRLMFIQVVMPSNHPIF